jgi:ankyrin repeat protein
MERIKFLVRECGFNVNSTVRLKGSRSGPNGPEVMSHWSPLAAAVISGNEATVRFLVRELSADVNIKCNENKISRTALFEAVRTGKEAMVRILVEELGADVNSRMMLNECPSSKPFLVLHYAMWMEMK